MDPNLLCWRDQGRSFFSRLKMWYDLLDPTLLLSSDPEIQKARSLIESSKPQDKKDESAMNLSLSSVHPDSGEVIPLVFRPPAFFLMSIPLTIGSLLLHRSVKQALFWQFLLQSYCAGFNHANRNSSTEQDKKTSKNQLLLMAGTVSYTSCAGALPQIIINQFRIKSPTVQMFFRSFFPLPLSAVLAFFNVCTVRSQETETGIQVFDRNGNPVGVSKVAAKKAVWETALSRALLFTTTAAIPQMMVVLLQRTRLPGRNSLMVGPFRPACIAFVLSLMVPFSFSLSSPLGMIKRELLEEEIQARAFGGQLFYHRGL